MQGTTDSTDQPDDPATETRPGSEGFRIERGEALEKGDDFDGAQELPAESIEEMDKND
jgi:hypothetical protein